MTSTKAQVGDLIRITDAWKDPHNNVKNGEVYEVTEVERYGVRVKGLPDRKSNYVADDEYEIHRKAGEEDSEAKAEYPPGTTFSPNGLYPIEPSKWSDTQPNLIRLAGAELTDLLVRKNHDYGDSFAQQYAKYGLMSALIRMDDKMRRLETLLDSEEQAQVSESLSDTLLDLAGYALLAYVETQKK